MTSPVRHYLNTLRATAPSKKVLRIVENLEAEQDRLADAWDEGFTAHFCEHERQRKDPSHPICRDNPYA